MPRNFRRHRSSSAGSYSESGDYGGGGEQQQTATK